MILHLCRQEEWDEAVKSGEYRAESLESEGFMHCSTPEQIVATAERHRKGQTGLLLLVIDPARVKPEMRWAEAKHGGSYPHIHGPLNLDAVVEARPFVSG